MQDHNSQEEIIQKGFEDFKKEQPYPHTEQKSFEAGAKCAFRHQEIKEKEGKWPICYFCGGQLFWSNDWDASDVFGYEESDGAIVTVWTCSTCGREYTIADPDEETRKTCYNEYWKEED